MARMVLRVMGPDPCLVTAGGNEVLLPPGKPYAVLCLILLEPSGVTRDDLAALLWADSPPQRARASVRQALHVLRRALGDEGPAEQGGHLTLDACAFSADLNELDRVLAAGNPEEAHRLWQGGPFSGFSLADAPAFNEWADRVRSRYERRLGDMLVQEASRAAAEARPRDALDWLSLALDVCPYDESSYALRVELLVAEGLLEEAQATLDRARDVVDDPTPGVWEELRQRLRNARLALLAPRSVSTHFPTLQFVGRTIEMAELRTLWRSVLSGRPRSAALLGTAGIGKSRLAEEFIRHTVGNAAAVVRVKAADAEGSISLGLVADLAKALSGQPGGAGMANSSLSVLRHLVPTMGNSMAPDPSGTVTDVAVAEAVLDLVDAVAHEQPLVMLIEGFHWCDARSRSVLLRVARSVRGVQVMTLVTCRSGDADLSAVRTLHAEAEAGRFTAFQLAPLSSAEIHETLGLSCEILPEADLDRVVTRLGSVSQGNPLFLSELLLRLHADGLITDREGHWSLDARSMHDDLPLPTSVRDVLAERLFNVPSAYQPLLALLAAAPEPLSPAHLDDATHTDRGQDALSDLVKLGVLMWDEHGRVTFAHDTLREAARESFTADPTARAPRRWIRWATLLVVLAIPLGFALERAWTTLGENPPPVRFSARQNDDQIELIWDGRTLTVGPTKRLIHGLVSPDGRRIATTLDSPDGVNLATVGLVASDTIQLTDAPLDEEPLAWSPDGRRLLYAKGRLLPGPDRVHVWVPMIVEPETGATVELQGFALEGQRKAAWSEDGSAVLIVARHGPDSGLFLVTPDGTGWKLVEGGLTSPEAPALSPDGTRVALRATRDSVDAVYVSWLKGGRPPEVLPGSIGGRTPVWLDNRAVACAVGNAGEIAVLVFDAFTGETLQRLPLPDANELHGDLRPARGRFIDSVALTLPSTFVSPGQMLAPTVTLFDRSGRRIIDPVLPLRWRTDETAVLRVDVSGSTTVVSTGVATLLAEVPGWRGAQMDLASVPVEVEDEVPILLEENWDTGLRSELWIPFGAPASFAVSEGGPMDGTGYFVNNGDSHYTSGVASRRRFDATDGLTLEVWGQAPLRGVHYESLGFGFSVTAPDDSRPAVWDPLRGSAVVIAGADGDRISTHGLDTNVRIEPPQDPRGWHLYALQLEGDGTVSLLVDGHLLFRRPLDPRVDTSTVHLVLFGASLETEMKHGPLRAYRGRRYRLEGDEG